MIAIIDYDIGNLAAVANMLQRLGYVCKVTADPSIIESAAKIILPGNGAFDACMGNLRSSGLVPLLEHRVQNDRVPLLGICVGAQMLGTHSAEGSEPGLGWLPMSVERFPDIPGLRVPHTGWNQVRGVRHDHPLVDSLAPNSRFYFVHSFYLKPQDPTDTLMMADYGITFAAAVARDNLYGVQFHPEKSHSFGKRLLAAFAGIR